jgi:GntR family negative regulator for fad regulon and positive regulator of fabA
MNWTTPPKPAELTEARLIDAILDEHFPPGSYLPAERELAQQLGVTRPTLREALQRLARDGWLEIRQGKPTRVKNYWHEGSLGVLGALAQRSRRLPADFIPNLLAVRQLIAPAYARQAIERDSPQVIQLLEKSANLEDSALAYASYDWEVHHSLAIASGNPIFTLILNGFFELYPPMACQYFQDKRSRQSSLEFYQNLLSAAQQRAANTAEAITRRAMDQSLVFWQAVSKTQPATDFQTKDCPPGGAA